MSQRKRGQRKPSAAERKAQSARDRARNPRGNHTNKPTNSGPSRRNQRRGGGGFNAVRVGRTVGGYFGKRGAAIGASAGQLFRNITGFGDYKVNMNSLTSGDSLPAFGNVARGTRVSHREFLFDVVTSPRPGEFFIQKVPIQPALLQSFPWLSASAENFQQYVLHGAVFEFKSNSFNAVSTTNTATGTVIMSTNYNVLDPDFNNKFTMEQSQFTCSAKPTKDLLHPIECAKTDTPLSVFYTRPGPLASGDLRLYDWGNFYIATVGMQGAAVNIGELWITYDLTLLKPKLGSTTDVYDHYVLSPANTLPGGPGYFGNSVYPPRITTDSDLGTTIISSTGGSNYNRLVWPSGYTGKCMVLYNVVLTSTASATLATPYNYIAGTGVTAISAFSSGGFSNEGLSGSNLLYNGNGGTTTTIFVSVVNGGYLQFSGGTNSGTPTSADLFIIALPENFFTSPLPPHSLTVEQKRLDFYHEPTPKPKSDLVDDDGDYHMGHDEWPEHPNLNRTQPILIPPRLTRGTLRSLSPTDSKRGSK